MYKYPALRWMFIVHREGERGRGRGKERSERETRGHRARIIRNGEEGRGKGHMHTQTRRESVGSLVRDRTRDPDLFLLATLIPRSDGWPGVGGGRSGASLCLFSLPSSHPAYFRLLFRAEDAFCSISNRRVSKGNANNLEILVSRFHLSSPIPSW